MSPVADYLTFGSKRAICLRDRRRGRCLRDRDSNPEPCGLADRSGRFRKAGL